MSEKETLNKWARILNGAHLEYGCDLREYQKEMKADGVIAAYGASDDLLIFEGAYTGEFGAWEGARIKIGINDDSGISAFDCNDREGIMRDFKRRIGRLKTIAATWCPKNEYNARWAVWHITGPDIDNEAYFDIWEDDGLNLNCRGLLFTAGELRRAAQ